ncbi:MAG: hypothetical protein HQ503_00635 [Rhodospirillales bacterium]|nr:hypothetical protein [Rhodospirillales bacterium]
MAIRRNLARRRVGAAPKRSLGARILAWVGILAVAVHTFVPMNVTMPMTRGLSAAQLVFTANGVGAGSFAAPGFCSAMRVSNPLSGKGGPDTPSHGSDRCDLCLMCEAGSFSKQAPVKTFVLILPPATSGPPAPTTWDAAAKPEPVWPWLRTRAPPIFT